MQNSAVPLPAAAQLPRGRKLHRSAVDMHVTHGRIHQQRRVDLEHTRAAKNSRVRASSAARSATARVKRSAASHRRRLSCEPRQRLTHRTLLPGASPGSHSPLPAAAAG